MIWLQNIQDVLDENFAENLQNQITQVNTALESRNNDLASQAVGKGASLIGVHDAANLFTSITVEGALKEAITAANQAKSKAHDIKSKRAGVVGAPLVSTDTQAHLQSKTQTIKDTLASNLTAKGQSSVGTETLLALVNKVPLISTGKKIATGTYPSFTIPSKLAIRTISTGFKPKYFMAYINGGVYKDDFLVRERGDWLGNIYCVVYTFDADSVSIKFSSDYAQQTTYNFEWIAISE